MSGKIISALQRTLRWLFGRKRWTYRGHLLDFFGRDFRDLQTHDKTFPGYDIASLNRALASFREDACVQFEDVGACPPGVQTLRQLFDNPYIFNQIPPPPVYERVPVNVDEEASVVINCLYLAVMRPEEGERAGTRHRVAIYLVTTVFVHDYWDSPNAQNVPPQQLKLSIACEAKEIADRVFADIEERRRRLSIFRGKVIDPVVGAGGIQTIGFRAIHQVREEDLILPDAVKALVRSAILGFYQHVGLLRELGIELKRGILFHGPPGTGKTSLCLYLAGQLPSFTVCFISGERLLYPREICRMARYLQPAMIVFEDIDLVAQDRNSNGLATVLGELMNQIDGCEPSDQVLFIMNTNSLERLEHAVKNRPGRVDQIVQIPLPDRKERELLLRRFARTLRLEQTDLSDFITATEGTTPAVLKEIVKRAAVSAVERLAAAGNGQPVVVSKADLLLAVEQVRALRDPELVPGSFGFRDSRA
jgi:hypothetical protein